MTNKTRIGIIGAGGVAREYHLPVLCNMPEVEIVWIFDVDPERAERLRQAFARGANVVPNLAAAADVDVVLVAIPVGYREPVLKEVFSRGWDALCEKPFARNVAEHDRFVGLASAKGRKIGVGLMRRFYRSVNIARDVIRSGALGEPMEILASQGTRMNRTGRDEWYQGSARAAGGGVLIETGSHLIDQILMIMGAAAFDLRACEQSRYAGLDVATSASGTLTLEGGAVVAFSVTLSSVDTLYGGIVVRFKTAELRIGVLPDSPVTLCDATGREICALTGSGATFAHQAFYLEWQDFLRACRDNASASLTDAAGARLSTEFIEQCYAASRSAEEGLA